MKKINWLFSRIDIDDIKYYLEWCASASEFEALESLLSKALVEKNKRLKCKKEVAKMINK